MRPAIFLGIFLIPFLSSAQTRQPDTLELDTRNGQKIILIGNDLNSFKNIKADSLIQHALSYYKDSIGPDGKLVRKKLSKADIYTRVLKNRRLFIIQPGIGAGLVRDKISPFLGLTLDFAPQRQDYYGKQWGDYTFINVTANAYYTFQKDVSNNYHSSTTVFVEGSIGNRANNRTKHYYFWDEVSFGAGYLIKDRGEYFKPNTFKLFASVIPNNSFVRLRSELYITDDFGRAFPGISVSAKLFGEEPLFKPRKPQKGKSSSPWAP